MPQAVLVRTLELLGEALEAIRAGADARTRLELALVKAARPEVDSSMRALLARIEALETAAAPGADLRGRLAARGPRAARARWDGPRHRAAVERRRAGSGSGSGGIRRRDAPERRGTGTA